VAAASTIRWGPAPESYASWRRCITPTNPRRRPWPEPELGELVGPPGGLKEGDLFDRREALERRHRRAPDAALGRVHDPTGADHVLRVQQQPQVCEDVLDLLALVEPHPADDAVRDAGPHEDVLQDPALGVRPVEDRDIRVPVGLVLDEPMGLLGDEQRLLVLVVGAEPHRELALGRLGPQDLGFRCTLCSISALAIARMFEVER
jgi:hypothetical protein